MSNTKTKSSASTKKSRKACVTIGSTQYELILTTRATREIATRYGGIEHLGDALQTSENLAQTLEEVVWLITLLANQSVAIHNLTHPNDKKTELTVEAVELLTVPADLAEYREAISQAIQHGTRRTIHTEPAPKDQANPKDT